jgi:hypothetical protein
MEVEFSILPQDLTAFRAFHRQTKPQSGPAPTEAPRPKKKRYRTSWMPNVIWVLVLVGLVIYMQLTGDVASSANGIVAALFNWAVPFGIGAILGILLMVGVLVWAKVITFQQDTELFKGPRSRWIVGPRRLRISPEGVYVGYEKYTSFASWPIIWFLGAGEEHLFLYISATEAFIIPRRAFADSEEAETFLKLAQRYGDEYRPAEPEHSTGITTTPTVLSIQSIQPGPPDFPS